MSIGHKNYDIHLEDNFFKIVEKDVDFETKNQAIDILLKIEYILKKHLPYLPSENDQYSLMKPQAVFAILEEISFNVFNKQQTEKPSVLSYFKIFSTAETVSGVYIRIMNLLYPPAIFSVINGQNYEIELPVEVTLKISSYLNLKSLKNLAEVNRKANLSTRHEIHKRAKLFGYKGEDSVKSLAYLTDFEEELKGLKIEYQINKIMEKVVPSTGLAYELKTFFEVCAGNSRLDEIDEKVACLTMNQFISLCHLSYQYQLPKIRCVFHENLILAEDEHPTSESLTIKKLFCLAIEFEDLNILKILFGFIKMPVSKIDDNHNTLIHIVTKYSSIEILKLFLEKGGSLINIKNLYGTTPLHYAVLGGCYEKVKLLLEYGAHTEIKDDLLLTPLAIACGCFSKNFEHVKKPIIELLLEYNSDKNLVVEGKKLKKHVLDLYSKSQNRSLKVIAAIL